VRARGFRPRSELVGGLEVRALERDADLPRHCLERAQVISRRRHGMVGVERTLRAAAEPDRNIIQFGGYTIRDGEIMMRELLDRESDFDAVRCCNNLIFLGAMRIFRQLDIDSRKQGYIQMAAFDIGR